MSPRRLSAEERALWDRVRASATPLRPAQAVAEPIHPRPAAPARIPPAPAPAPASPDPWAARPFRIGERADRRPAGHDLLPGPAEGLRRAPLRMDAGAFGRMSRGKLRPEARLDLHGMSLAEAHPALASFLLDARARGRRLVLVITGKGRVSDDLAPMPARAGRLRHDVPRWLSLPPLAEHVLQVAPAHRRHGGEGALYVYLRA